MNKGPYISLTAQSVIDECIEVVLNDPILIGELTTLKAEQVNSIREGIALSLKKKKESYEQKD